MADPYQNTIDFAAKRYAAAVDGYRAIEAQIASLSADPANIGAGGVDEARYAALQKQLADASKSWQDAENDYQTAIQAQDKARVDAKDLPPAGSTRTRLDTTAGNVLVSVTETADGRGGWSADPNSVKRVQVQGSQAAGMRISAPTSDRYVVTMQDDGSLKQQDNPNYQPDKNAAPSAVPTSEFVWNPQTGKVEQNPAYRPPATEINTTARQINDPAHPGQLINNPNYRAPDATVSTTAQRIPDPNHPGAFIDNPNYRPPAATINTTARQIEDPAHPGQFINNPNYQSPTDQLTPGGEAVDTATANTAADIAAANLKKAQADADAAALALQDAKRRAAQAPTDAQAQQAIATAQQAADLANKNLAQQIAQSANLNPIALQQAQATLDRTKQTIEQAQQGDLYGRQQQIQQIRSLVASGDVSPAEGDQMVAALNRGTTVFDATKQAQSDRLTARGQTASNLNSLAGNFASTFNSGFSTLADMNKYAKVGSSAGADAFLALLNIAQDRLGQYKLPDAPDSNYLGTMSAGTPSPVGAMAAAAQTPPAPAPQPSYGGMNIGSGAASNPQPPGVGAHQVTINIGTPAPVSSGTEGVGNPWAGGNTPAPGTTWQNPAMSGLVSQAAKSVPASEEDIWNAYGVQKPQTAGAM